MFNNMDRSFKYEAYFYAESALFQLSRATTV